MSITYERKVQVIPPKINIHTTKKQEVKRIRVAAYCRVSTTQESQETSYDSVGDRPTTGSYRQV